MNDFFQENKRILFILMGVLALFAVVLLFFIVRPIMVDLKTEKQNVVLEENETKILEAQIDGLSDDTTNIDIEQLLLEKQVPSERKLDEYILSLQQLEQYSNSAFERIGFSYDSSINAIDEDEVEDETDTAPENETDEEVVTEAEEQLEENADDDELEEEREQAAPVFLTEIPQELEVMTVTVTALVPSYEELVNLVRAIEDQDRISIVSRMRATVQTEEEELFDEETEMIAIEIDVSTFYYAE